MTPPTDSTAQGIRSGFHPSGALKTLTISVIVPVRNEARHIRRTLAQLIAQQYDNERFEIIVVDGESDDGTPQLVEAFARRYSNVHLLRNVRRLSSAARNIGIRHARGDVVVIIDGHCELKDDRFLEKLAAAFETSGADCVGRPQPLEVSRATALQQAIAAARCSRLGHHPDSYVYSSREQYAPAASVAIAYRRSVFETVGTFDESFDACEDVELNHRVDRAGMRCFLTPAVAVNYIPRATLGSLFRQLARYGRGRLRLTRKHPRTASIGTLVPAAFVLGLVAGLPLSVASDALAAIYGGTLLLYLTIVALTSVVIAIRCRNRAILPWLPLVFATIHIASGTGFLLECFAHRPSGRSMRTANAHEQGAL